jgi:energy-coupling factor transporter ATP-binding protein EcfA2
VPIVQISFDDAGRSTGAFAVGTEEKLRIDIIRDSMVIGDRSFLFHGRRGSGKSALATQMAAILQAPYEPIHGSPADETAYLVSSGGEESRVLLDPEGAQRLVEGLGSGSLVHLIDIDPGLRAPLARALSVPQGQLTIQPLGEAGWPEGEPTSVLMHHSSLAVFEVSDEAEGTLSPADAAHLTPLFFEGLSQEAGDAKAKGSDYQSRGGGQPQPAGWGHKGPDGAPEVTAAVQRLESESVLGTGRSRDGLCADVVGLLRKHNPAFSGPDAYRYADHWLRLVEIQAYGGDPGAAKTCSHALRALVPAGGYWERELPALVASWASALGSIGQSDRAGA